MVFPKSFYYLRVLFRELSIRFYTSLAYSRLRLYGVEVGRNLKVTGPLSLYIHWRSNVVIGNNCTINSGFLVNPVGGYRSTGIYVGPNASLVIKNNVGISNTTISCFDRIEINDYAFIGGGCNIYDSDFHSLNPYDRGTINDRPCSKPVSIGKRCFIGGHSTVLKGVIIGEGAVIGAGSIVPHSVPDFEMWAGNPANFVKRILPEN